MAAYKRYLETLYESVVDRNLLEYYDCISRIGYIAKCNHYDDIDCGKGIEVNTSGISRAGHVLPHPSIINRYKKLGGKIIKIGSDAHKAENVGCNIGEAVRMLKEMANGRFLFVKKA